MAQKHLGKKPEILKAGAKDRRTSIANLNQKHQVFAHKNSKRKKTRQSQKDAAIRDSSG